MRKNWLVTVGGIMAGFLAIPLGMSTLGYRGVVYTCVGQNNQRGDVFIVNLK